MIDVLLFLSNTVVPDIKYAEKYLARSIHKTILLLWKVAKHIVSRLKGMVDIEILLPL